jgi:hypothetical protein
MGEHESGFDDVADRSGAYPGAPVEPIRTVNQPMARSSRLLHPAQVGETVPDLDEAAHTLRRSRKGPSVTRRRGNRGHAGEVAHHGAHWAPKVIPPAHARQASRLLAFRTGTRRLPPTPATASRHPLTVAHASHRSSRAILYKFETVRPATENRSQLIPSRV